jgi:hypothetical protein
MNLHPSRTGSMIVASATATAEEYGLARYQKHMPASDQAEAEANQLSRLLIVSSQEKLSHLLSLETNWDGHGSEKPQAAAVANAAARLPELYRLCTLRGVWREPHVSSSEEGEVSFEWWSRQRKVTMYFGPSEIEVIRVWGPDIDTQMDQQQRFTLDAFPAVWAWLYGN